MTLLIPAVSSLLPSRPFWRKYAKRSLRVHCDLSVSQSGCLGSALELNKNIVIPKDRHCLGPFDLPASLDEVICINSAICCLSLIGVVALGLAEVDTR